MKVEYGDIWKHLGEGRYVVIPTNLGWKKDGCNVMGAGLAKDATRRYPTLAKWYGGVCEATADAPQVIACPFAPLIMFPVKPLNKLQPWMSWKQKADLKLIEQSARQLYEWPDPYPIAVPLVGCGNGQLDMYEVRPILEKYLASDRFTLVLEEWRNPSRS